MRLDNASITILAAAGATLFAACTPAAARPGSPPGAAARSEAPGPPRDPHESHLEDLRQLTFGGENAEAYWSSDGTELIMQSTHDPYKCDQIFRMDALEAGADYQLVSTGKGRTTCSYFFPGDQRVLFASTHAAGPECPPVPDHSHGYVWPIYDSYDIYSAKPDGSELKPLIAAPGYDAEATVCAKDGSIVFTSTRDGDIDLYRADADGSHVVRLTDTPGYDGGAFFSADCKQIVWRASRPQGKDLEEFRALLKQGLVKPGKLELYVGNADGSEARQITYLDAASFAPFFFPSGKRIIFSSNYGDPKGREFDLWAVNTDGTGLERITYSAGFDGFPIFSPDGKRLAFSSNRNQKHEGDTDVYIATWNDAPAATAAAAPTGADRTMADVAWLADDAREGRGIGTAGLDASADWLAHKLAELGATAPESGWKQPFDVVTGARLVPEATSLTIDGKPVEAAAFVPLGYSLTGVAEGEVVAASFGVTAPEAGRDDYKKLNVKGKIVVVRRFAPDGEKFKDDKLSRRYGDLHFKAWNAREHGAKALIVVDVPVGAGKPAADAPLPRLNVDGQGGDAGIPVIVVTRAAGAKLMSGKHQAVVKVGLQQEKKPAYNIIGKIEATGPGKLPGVIVIGAHYDHLGMGQVGSLAPDVQAVHNGADDNASGVAALLEVGRTLVARRAELKRDVWLVAFSGEELGVLGSAYFVSHPPKGLAIADVVAMLNMDMVGRLRMNRLTVLGGESADEWPALVSGACAARRVECTVNGSGYGPSDHTPFYAAKVPVLHFFSGAHADYHRPTDDAALINAAGMGQVALVVADVALATAAHDARLTLKSTDAPPPDGDRRSYGASLGTVPDYSGPPAGKSGVLLSAVRPGSAAEKAGMKRGDLLVGIGDHEIRTIEDFMYVLQGAKPGQKSSVTVEREGKKVTLDVTFGESTRR
jgi:Zn-dependent M28 family amino/carboxypeptidase/Tol biopolymer transport system component